LNPEYTKWTIPKDYEASTAGFYFLTESLLAGMESFICTIRRGGPLCFSFFFSYVHADGAAMLIAAVESWMADVYVGRGEVHCFCRLGGVET